MDRNEGKPSWTVRRRIIISTLLFNAIVIIVSLLRDIPESVAEVAITNAFWSSSMLIGSYVFGAVWDDKGKPQ